MIVVEKSKPYRMCNCCNSSDKVAEIYFRSEHQGVGVALCEQCRKELIAELDRLAKVENWGKDKNGNKP